MKIAIAQLNPTIGNLTFNAKKILEAAQKAIESGANLLLTPELSLCGYPPRDLLLDPSFIEAMATQLQIIAKKLPPSLITLVGIATPNDRWHVTGGKPLYNSIALLQQGKIQQIFHKRLLPTYDVFDEYRYFEPGGKSNDFAIDCDRLEITDTANERTWKIGVTICEDLWNDEEFWGKRNYPHNPIAELAELGVDLIVNLSASPYTVGKQALREKMLNHAVTRYQKPILYVNQVGGNDDLVFDGNSVAFNR
ncbi:MAG: NAD+ synthase, partial [Cyanobacteria bacterium J055]